MCSEGVPYLFRLCEKQPTPADASRSTAGDPAIHGANDRGMYVVSDMAVREEKPASPEKACLSCVSALRRFLP